MAAIHIVPSLIAPDTWYLFREDGTEVKVWLYRGELLSKQHLTKDEKTQLETMLNGTIIRPSKINNQ